MIYIFIWDKRAMPIKKIGYIRAEKLIAHDDNWNIRRIPIKCENCEDNDYYELKFFYRKSRFMYILSLGKCDQTYFITCPNCNKYRLDLEDEEYYELKRKKLIQENLPVY